MKFPGPNLATRSDGKLALRDRLAMLGAYAVLQLAGRETRERMRADLVAAGTRWADHLRTRDYPSVHVRRTAPGVMCPECSGPVEVLADREPDTVVLAGCLDCGWVGEGDELIEGAPAWREGL